MTREHTVDLRNVRQGDRITIETTHSETHEVECTSKEKRHADPRSREVRHTTIWKFEGDSFEAYCSILDGLRSSQDDPQFPQHSQLIDDEYGTEYGYITSLQLTAHEA